MPATNKQDSERETCDELNFMSIGVSARASTLATCSEGEFSNIKNNPLWQTKNLEAVQARYIKLRALKNTENNNRIGYAEIDVITD